MTAHQLRARRLRLGWSRNQLAQILGVPIDAVCDWENGTRPIEVPAAVEQVLRRLESRGRRDSRSEDEARAS
jgi:transcriptional regulator with XRE-family HTH domain